MKFIIMPEFSSRAALKTLEKWEVLPKTFIVEVPSMAVTRARKGVRDEMECSTVVMVKYKSFKTAKTKDRAGRC